MVKARKAVSIKVEAGPPTKFVVDVDGRRYRLQTLDVRSKSFGQEFGAAFKKSVKKARRENTSVIGSPDGAVSE
jgi:hypothetical protein